MAVLREALGYSSQTAWAQFLGMSLERWNNYERGSNVPSAVALQLVQKVGNGLSLDWIYNGKREALTVDLDRRLREAEARLYSDRGLSDAS